MMCILKEFSFLELSHNTCSSGVVLDVKHFGGYKITLWITRTTRISIAYALV